MKTINKTKFIETFYKDFPRFSIMCNKYKTTLLLTNLDDYMQESVIQFLPAGKYLYTIYINTGGSEFLNNYLVDYFKNLKLDKNYIVADRMNNIDYVC